MIISTQTSSTTVRSYPQGDRYQNYCQRQLQFRRNSSSDDDDDNDSVLIQQRIEVVAEQLELFLILRPSNTIITWNNKDDEEQNCKFFIFIIYRVRERERERKK